MVFFTGFVLTGCSCRITPSVEGSSTERLYPASRGAFIVAHTPSTRLALTGRCPHRFFSVTADLATATAVADTTTDVILRLRLKHGRAVEDYSCFPETQEVVASARARFVVASGPRVEGGYTYVDLVEESREYF